MGKEKDNLRSRKSIQSISSRTSLKEGSRPHVQFYESYVVGLQEAVALRKNIKITYGKNENMVDLTPVLLDDKTVVSKFSELNQKLRAFESDIELDSLHDLQQRSTQKFLAGKSLDGNVPMNLSSHSFFPSEEDAENEDEYRKLKSNKTPPFIKILLNRTKEILFFEQESWTVSRGSREGESVDADNKLYDFLTLGKGRMRRTNIAETQTVDKLYKSRTTNTPFVAFNTQISLVSNFLMFKTFQSPNSVEEDPNAKSNSNEEGKSMSVSPSTSLLKKAEEIFQKSEFKTALMSTLRILAGNVFQEQQRRFRNLIMPNPLARDCEYKYAVNLLFQFNPQQTGNRKSLADIAFCPGNGDIIAAAYGIYSFGAMHVPDNGYCCVWNIKNPINPERIYWFKVAVVSVQFSPYTPQLLAIGLYDGSVEIYDISTFCDKPIAVSLRTKDSTCDPIISLEWIPQVNVNVAGAENTDIEPLLALAQDGTVTKYRIIRSPYLLAFNQIELDQIQGHVEGLYINSTWNDARSNRYPQGLALKKHPSQHDIYFILTDGGCVHKCSTNYPHQHLEVLQAHNGAVSDMDYSPWSPKLFLTAGNDWCIRVWMEGILEPLITLKHGIGPIHSAAWSKTHSTVIVSNSRSLVHVWDIRRCILKPISSCVDKSYCTLFKLSRCGRSMALGNERGSVLVCAFDSMPFPPHFQYEELELAIYRAIAAKPELTNQLKSIGFFGYADQNSRRKKSHRCNAST